MAKTRLLSLERKSGFAFISAPQASIPSAKRLNLEILTLSQHSFAIAIGHCYLHLPFCLPSAQFNVTSVACCQTLLFFIRVIRGLFFWFLDIFSGIRSN